MVVLMDDEHRSKLAQTGLKASRKDLDQGDPKKLRIWREFAEAMNDQNYRVLSGQWIDA